MKVIKPQRLGLLTKVFEHRREQHLTVSVMVCFPFASPRRLLHEASLWKLAADEMGLGTILDECNPKVRGEVLVNGRCFAPGGAACIGSSVRVQIGAVDKTLYVVGDRRWGPLGMSDPEPFTEMPVTWSRAFGGEGFADNPAGRGVAAVQSDGASVHWLPNVEDPDHLVKSPRDRPTPVGLDGYGPTAAQRASKLGTYDQAWADNDRPGLPRDFDPAYFNTAPADQQIEGYFRGDETFAIENMHPTRPRIEGALPGLVARCFIARGPEEELRETAMRLDTVRLFPHRERGILVFRGVFDVREDDADDVQQIMAACEAMGEPKPLEHYQTVLAQRLDKQKRHLFALRDQDLLHAHDDAAATPLPDDRLSGIAALIRRDDYHRKHMERGRQKRQREDEARIEENKTKLRAAGIDPDAYFPQKPERPAAPEPPAPEDFPQFLAQMEDEIARHRAEIEREVAEAQANARAQAEKHQVDFDKLTGRTRKLAGGPPKLSAQKELEKLQDLKKMADNGGVKWPALDAQLDDANLMKKLAEQEQALLRSYRRFAHHFPAASRLEGDPAKQLRDEVIAGHAAGQSFRGRDLTGADLSHLDLSGIDLHEAMLEAAVLTNTNLRGADLTGAVFARADLSGADLSSAKITGANFGSAILRDVKARGGLDLGKATFAKADLAGADFTGARLASADFSEATFQGADFSKVTGEKLFFLRVDLSDATFAGASLKRCTFIESDVSDVDLRGADLSASTFITARGDGAIFREAKLDKLRAVQGSSFAGADFTGASLEKANLMGTRLHGSDFTGANLRNAVLNNADLSEATLDRAVLVDALLVRTNLTGASLFAVDLMNAVLSKANLRGADFEKANLFGADASRMVGDADTSLSGANVKRVNFVAARRPDEQG